MWFGRHQPEVLVVGAGPVGLAAAIMLADRGIDVELIDERFEGVAAHLPDHAELLHPSSLEILESIGVSSEILTPPGRISRVVVYDELEPRATMYLSALGQRFPYAATVTHAALMEELTACLHQRKRKVRAPMRLADLEHGGATANAVVEELVADSGGLVVDGHLYLVRRTRDRHPRFVIATDGPRSTARRRINIELDPTAAPTAYATVDCKAGDLDGEARIVVGDRTTDALWPLGGDRCRWILEMQPKDRREYRRRQPRDPLDVEPVATDWVEQTLAERAPWFHGEPEDEALCLPIEPSYAHSFGLGRVWLAGDAAHVANPIGAQSINAGFSEARDLADSLARVLRGGAPAETLDRYDIERHAEWRRSTGKDGTTLSLDPSPWIAAHANELLACIPGTGRALRALAVQIGVELPH